MPLLFPRSSPTATVSPNLKIPHLLHLPGVRFQLHSPSAGSNDGVINDNVSSATTVPETSSSSESNAFQYDEDSKTMRVDLSALQEGGSQSERRTRLVTFTCNKCGARDQ